MKEKQQSDGNYYFGKIRQDYAELVARASSEVLDKHVGKITLRALTDHKDHKEVSLHPDSPSQFDNTRLVTEDAEEYWKASKELRDTLNSSLNLYVSLAMEQDMIKGPHVVQRSNDPPRPNNPLRVWPLSFFQEHPKKTAAVLLGIYEGTSIGITSSINKDVLTNIHSSSMLAVYLSPVAAVILVFVAAAAYTQYLKNQNRGSSNNTNSRFNLE